MSQIWKGPLERIDAFRWRIPRFLGSMRVEGLIFADETLISRVRADQALQQVVHVAHLPGLAGPSMAMPDIHWGYGFPIGGVAAMDIREGVVSPGGVGYDINCGVRLMRTDLDEDALRSRLKILTERLYANIPSGVGSSGKLKLDSRSLKKVLTRGSKWAVEQGFGCARDLERTEDGGCMEGADADALSSRALERGKPQLGTLGAGNHFIEIQVVDAVYDFEAARAYGLRQGMITLMIHTGSRGLGYQVCDDHVGVMMKAMTRYQIEVPDRQLACAPVESAEGRRYLAAMAAAANYAWTNRQIILHCVRESFEQVFQDSAERLGLDMIYDVAHNIAKFETHETGNETRRVLVHRKGATRAFGPGRPEIPEVYRSIGQPVLIPGDMGTASYVLRGTSAAMKETFGSTCHGAGRVLSRHAAQRAAQGRRIDEELARKGILVLSRSRKTLAEEAPEAYKDIHEVVEIVHGAGISKKVVRMKPLAVIKG
ncbi:MAG TPA: RtcB family protein [bacterium]|nr:RtcB family protein [bacterium]